MSKVTDRFDTPARWTPDVNGKQNFDGTLVAISTRYWPAWKNSDGRPSANAALMLNVGPLSDGDEPSESRVLVEADFSGSSEAEVKFRVEEWLSDQCARVAAVLAG